MKRKINILDEKELNESIDSFLKEADARARRTGKSLQEAMAEITAEEEAAEEEKKNLPATYVRAGLEGGQTVLIADTGKRKLSEVVGVALDFYLPEVIELNKFKNVEELWNRLSSADPEKTWVADGVESVTDEAIEECIFYMLKRDEYVPSSIPRAEPIDFDKLRLILVTKAKDELEAVPSYCHGHSLSMVIVKA